MGLLDKYQLFKARGVKLIPFQAHAGMAFFFSTIAAHLSSISIFFWLVPCYDNCNSGKRIF